MKLDTLIEGHKGELQNARTIDDVQSARTVTVSQVITELFPFLILVIVTLSGAYL